MNLGAAIAGGNGKRRAHDFYPTPPDAGFALLSCIRDWPLEVLEPACGDGALSRVLETAGFNVTSSDLIDRGYGCAPVDFLSDVKEWRGAVVTNPPFALAVDFIVHSHRIGASHLALLLKASFWNAAARLRTWDVWAPYARHDLTWRLDFTGGGAPTMDCAWFLWDRTSPPLARPLAKLDLEGFL